MFYKNLNKRKRIYLFTILFVIVLLLIGFISIFKEPKQYEKEAFINGKIYTVDSNNPWAEAMVIENDKIIFVGSNNDAKNIIDKDTKVHDVDGKLMLPGFIESHAHIGLVSSQLGLDNSLFIEATWDKDTILNKLESFIKKNKDLDIIVGFGFDANVFGTDGPLASDLDKLEKDKPIFILDEGGHTAWVNSKAMEIGGINKDTPDPVPGIHYFKRDSQGNPTGWLKEAQSFVPLAKKLNIITEETSIAGANTVLPIISQNGITTVHDGGMMGYEDTLLSAFSKMEKDGDLPIRLVGSYMVQSPKVLSSAVDSLKNLNSKFDSKLITVDTLKIQYDGTLEAKTAAMFENYGADNNENGKVLFDVDKLKQVVYDNGKAGFNVYIHAIGDKALDNAIESFEYLEENIDDKSIRKTIGHAQFFNKDSVERLTALDDVVIQTTLGWFGPSGFTLDTVGKERYEMQGLFNSLDKNSVKLSFGSDFPVGLFNGLNPFYNMQVGYTRQYDSTSEEVLPPFDETLPLETLIKGYTINGAYQLGMEDEVGSLEVGKKADFIILENNIFEQPKDEIVDNKVLKTYMNGDLVFKSNLKSWLIDKLIISE